MADFSKGGVSAVRFDFRNFCRYLSQILVSMGWVTSRTELVDCLVDGIAQGVFHHAQKIVDRWPHIRRPRVHRRGDQECDALGVSHAQTPRIVFDEIPAISLRVELGTSDNEAQIVRIEFGIRDAADFIDRRLSAFSFSLSSFHSPVRGSRKLKSVGQNDLVRAQLLEQRPGLGIALKALLEVPVTEVNEACNHIALSLDGIRPAIC